MDEREFSTSVEVGVSKFSPFHATVQLAFRRKWEARATEVLGTAAEAAGLSPSEMESRVAEQEELGDLLYRATERAAQTSAADYRSDLARLVSAAFRDEALIEPVSYLTGIVVQLEPADLRVLRTLATTESSQVMKAIEPHTFPRGVQVLTEEVADRVTLEPPLVAASLARLDSFGFVYTKPHKDKKFAQTRAVTDARLWSVTPLGSRAIVLCNGSLVM
jgi:hypothetical protein